MRKQTQICGFCHCKIDGTIYRHGNEMKLHVICHPLYAERHTKRRHVFVGPVFRMLSFSGEPGLKLRVA